MRPNINEMSVEEFAAYLKRSREAVINFTTQSGAHNGRHTKSSNTPLFVSQSVKRTMQRKRTK